MKKRLISAFLCLCMVMGMIPTVFAVEAAPQNKKQETDDMKTQALVNDVAVNGENSVGTLLSNTIADNQQEQAAQACSISDLQVEDNIAVVSCRTITDADVVVAAYTEDQKQMLASGTTRITSDDREVEVTIETDNMPQYFTAVAYLLDAETHNPVSEEYVSRYYTKEFQDFLKKTTNDFDKDQVLNLDENEETNFVVYEDGTIIKQQTDGVNEIKDNGDNTYTITNSDSDICGLKAGDTLSYTYTDGTVLIIKVQSVKVEGTTVTITAVADASLEDVFEYVKIETDTQGQDVQIDNSNLDDGLKYIGENVGILDKEAEQQSRAIDISGEEKKSIAYEFKGVEGITGSIELSATAEVKAYISSAWIYVSLGFNSALDASIQCEKGLNDGGIEKQLGKVQFSTSIPGVVVGFTPKFVMQASVKFSWNGTVEAGFGSEYDSRRGLTLFVDPPHTTSALALEGSIYIGLKGIPYVAILTDDLCKMEVPVEAGIELKSELDTKKSENMKHDCKLCFTGEINAKAEFSIAIALFKDDIKLERSFQPIQRKITDFYYSDTYNSFGFECCPHKRYKMTIKTVDSNNTAISCEVCINGILNTVKTDTNGNGEIYLPNGTYIFSVTENGKTSEKRGSIQDNKSDVKIVVERKNDGGSGGNSESEGTIIDQGACGENATWVLTDNGTLTINGNGSMDDYNTAWNTPWYYFLNEIKRVVINPGITSVGRQVFAECYNLKSVTIPDSVMNIGPLAFGGCSSLTNVSIGKGVTGISNDAFEDCEALISIDVDNKNTTYYSENGVLFDKNKTTLIRYPSGRQGAYRIPDGVTTIGYEAFEKSKGLTSITIPDSVTNIENLAFWFCGNLNSVELSNNLMRIGKSAFEGCGFTNIVIPDNITQIAPFAFASTALKSITIPNNIESIGENAFSQCKNLESVSISDGVVNIGEGAFSFCSNLKEMIIPNSVIEIGQSSFRGCSNMENIYVDTNNTNYISQNGVLFNKKETELIYYPDAKAGTCIIPVGVTEIVEFAFEGCENLTGIVIPDSVTSIGDYAFRDCSSLPSITMPNRVTNIGEGAFETCNSLTTITIPEGIKSIKDYTFESCQSLKSVTIPIRVTSIGNHAFQDCSNLRDVYYTGTEKQWKKVTIGSVNGGIVNATIHYNYNSTQHSAVIATELPIQEFAANANQGISMLVDFSGSTSASGNEQTSSFNSLIPNEAYVLLVLKDKNAENLLSADNLLYIAQNTADQDGKLSFSYIPREQTEDAAVILCGASKEEHVHKYLETITKQPSCTENGIRTYTCNSCEDSYTEEIPAIGHTWNGGEITKSTTCTENGVKTYTCETCKETKTEEIKATGHSFTDYIYNYDAQVGKDGTETATCDNGCGTTDTRAKSGTALQQPTPTINFTDVDANQYYAQPVQWAVTKGITDGIGDNKFAPDMTCTRGQIVTFLWRAKGKPEPTSNNNPFDDVFESDYYYKAVLWAVEQGITTGTSATTFSPNAGCTRAQVATFLWRAEGKPSSSVSNPFYDVNTSEYYGTAVLWAVEKNITKGTSETTFSPEATCTRGQIVTFLYRDMA